MRRRRYNVALVASAFLAFVAYLVVMHYKIRSGADGEWEITIFTLAFNFAGSLCALGLANVLYGLGPFAESIVKPENPASFRLVCFTAGLVASVVAFFTIPVLVALS